jgi:Myb/SANT-like DNA-binding domain
MDGAYEASQENSSLSPGEKHKYWEKSEIVTFLELQLEKNVISLMDSKSIKHTDIYKMLSEELAVRGFQRTAEQCKTKFKSLKADYSKMKAQLSKSGAAGNNSPIFDLLNQLHACRPKNRSSEFGIDTLGECYIF